MRTVKTSRATTSCKQLTSVINHFSKYHNFPNPHYNVIIETSIINKQPDFVSEVLIFLSPVVKTHT